jgi:endonuclease YncB( thermonuclease family)
MGWATAAHADPCTAPVTGHRPGQVITGQVRYVVDGDGLCIGKSRDPSTWTEIRLEDWSAPELSEPGGKAAKAALSRSLGAQARCTVQRGRGGWTTSFDRVIASCTVGGVSLRERMKRLGQKEGGR